jgi:hypothetical protein
VLGFCDLFIFCLSSNHLPRQQSMLQHLGCGRRIFPVPFIADRRIPIRTTVQLHATIFDRSLGAKTALLARPRSDARTSPCYSTPVALSSSSHKKRNIASAQQSETRSSELPNLAVSPIPELGSDAPSSHNNIAIPDMAIPEDAAAPPTTDNNHTEPVVTRMGLRIDQVHSPSFLNDNLTFPTNTRRFDLKMPNRRYDRPLCKKQSS